ncbi:MAG: hypothetical protein KatS3mg101_0620 [Patescibacteria group bacterium]|nr:MAG: hypothetical protein KatS3mg101_0620 [Patescibacteria group bacterium]
MQVEKRVITKTVSASGEVKSKNQADLTFTSAGKISDILVKSGDVVKKGQLLAYLDSSSQSQTTQYYKDARDIALRNKELFIKERETNIRSLGGEDEYNIKIRQMDELISQAEAAYQAQVALLNNFYIYAPFDGTVVDVYKKVGETAVLGERIMTVADMNNFVFGLSIDQEDFGLVRLGQTAKINLDSYENFDFKTTVTELPVAANATSGSFYIEIPIKDAPEHPLAIGMSGDAYIDILTSDREVSSLTIDEIFYDLEDNPYVWIAENRKLKKRFIEIGLEGDIYTEVKTDVTEVLVPAQENQKMVEGYNIRIIN